MSRFFQVCPDRTVTLPQGLQSGPGQTNVRLPAGSVIELDGDRCVAFGKFVNGRVRAEDWKEVDEATAKKLTASSPAPAYVPSPDQKSMDIRSVLDMTPTKER